MVTSIGAGIVGEDEVGGMKADEDDDCGFTYIKQQEMGIFFTVMWPFGSKGDEEEDIFWDDNGSCSFN